MGCDIHYVIEKKFNDKWVGVYCSGGSPLLLTTKEAASNPFGNPVEPWRSIYNRRSAFSSRNYAFFGKLAGVRDNGPPAKGLPPDMSELAYLCAGDWDGDGHSHSYDTLYAFCSKWLEVTDEKALAAVVGAEVSDQHSPVFDFLTGCSGKEAREIRVVYWFDN